MDPITTPPRSARHDAAVVESRQALALYQQAAIHALKSQRYMPCPEGARLLQLAATLLVCVTQRDQRLRS